jgi:hypothetical protein
VTSRAVPLRDRIGRIIGACLWAIAVLSMIGLAAIGFQPALYLLILLIVGAGLVAYGAHSQRR